MLLHYVIPQAKVFIRNLLSRGHRPIIGRSQFLLWRNVRRFWTVNCQISVHTSSRCWCLGLQPRVLLTHFGPNFSDASHSIHWLQFRLETCLEVRVEPLILMNDNWFISLQMTRETRSPRLSRTAARSRAPWRYWSASSTTSARATTWSPSTGQLCSARWASSRA